MGNNTARDKVSSSSSGFMILPMSSVPHYRGVDRNPFQPTLVEDEITLSSRVLRTKEPAVWMFYPPGWRRDAYRLYEENLATGSGEDLLLVNSLDVAREICRLIEPHLGFHEIVRCKIGDLSAVVEQERTSGFLGYDVAYPGGDFYSAILNGLLHNPHPELVRRYGGLLNEFGLFSSAEPVEEYVASFRRLVPSETDSTFCLFWLAAALRED